MATESQIAANRQNAENSTGPRTEEGKARASRNAVTFGIYSAADFVRPDETHTYQLFCQHFKKDLRPEGALEQTLAAEIIHAAWRLRRCATAESEMDSSAEDPILTHSQASIDRARAEAQRQLLRAANELRRLQTERQIRAECLPSAGDIHAIGGLANMKDVKFFRQKIAAPAAFPPAESARQNEPNPKPPKSVQTPRNAPCPCNSGEKYKRCCGRNAPPVLQQAA